MIGRLATMLVALWLGPSILIAAAASPPDRAGWVVHPTAHDFTTLVQRTEAAIDRSPLNKVTSASASQGARSIGQTIPGNMVIGVFAPPFAVRLLAASLAAGIEAPLRLYLTENADGTATLSYIRPSHRLAAYPEGGAELDRLASELDAILAAIAGDAAAP